MLRKEIEHYVDLNGCHICTSHFCLRGYPRINRGGRVRNLASYLYEQANGPLEKDEVVRHTCGNGASGCINLAHMIRGTQADNNQDRVEHGGYARGEQKKLAKLNEGRAWYIRHQKRFSRKKLAEMFGVDPSQISHVKSGRRWNHSLHAAELPGAG